MIRRLIERLLPGSAGGRIGVVFLLVALLCQAPPLFAAGCTGSDGNPIVGCLTINASGGGVAFNATSFSWSGTPAPLGPGCTASPAVWGATGPGGFAGGGEGDTLNVTFGGGGMYLISVTLPGTCGTRGTGSRDFAVYVPPVITGLTTFPARVVVDKPADFGAESSFPSSPTSVDYNFGDGQSCTGCDYFKSHTYAFPGEYDFVVAARNPAGTTTKTFKVVVYPDPPTVDLNFDTSGPRVAGTPVQFDSTIGGGEPARQILWDFGDGTTSTQEDPSHVFAATDQYVVSLSVTNRWGTVSETIELFIEPKSGGGAPPSTASFSFDPLLPVTGQQVRFTDKSTGTITRWRWDFNFRIGQALKDADLSYSQNPTHVYGQSGQKDVGLWVSNAYGTKGVILFVDVRQSGQPPVANFTWSPLEPRVNETIQFTDASAGATAWLWNFGDGATSTAQHPTHAFSSSGQKVVRLTVTNPWGTNDVSKNFPCKLPDGGPALDASFTWSPTSPRPGEEVAFADNSSGSPETWSWNFSDGFTSNVQNPRHPFASVGTYTVSLTVGKSGQTDTSTRSISVTENSKPTANFTWSPASPRPNQPVSFSDLSSGAPTSFQWTFGDGSSSTSRHPQHTFATAGAFIVKLTVSNAAGSDLISRTVEVSEEARKPEASFSWSPSFGSAGSPISFTDTSTGPPESWLWTFGDGSSSSSQHPSHTFTVQGTYSVTLTVTNAKGLDSDTLSVGVGPSGKPVAGFTFTPPSPAVAEVVVFTSTSTGSPTLLQWTFGDGGSATGALVTHIYTQAGAYAVTLTATNDLGTDSKTQTIGVGVPPVLSADFTTGVPDVIVHRAVQFIDRSAGSPDSWFWDFGDGHASTEQSPVHTFVREGIAVVTLTVAKREGTQAPATKSIPVSVYAAPVAKFATSGDLAVGLPVRFTDQSKGPARAWKWSADGVVLSREPAFEHTFNSMGRPRVQLEVLNPAGADTATRPIEIGPRPGDGKPVINDITGTYGPCFYSGGPFRMDVPYNATIDWKSLQVGTVSVDVNGTPAGTFDVSGILNPDRITLDTDKLLTDPDKVRENTIGFRAKAKEGAESYPQSIYVFTYPMPSLLGSYGTLFKRVVEPNRVAFVTGYQLPPEPLDKVFEVPGWVPGLGGHPLGIKETQFKLERSFRTDCTTLTNIEISGGIAIGGGSGAIKGGATREVTLSKSSGLEVQSQYEVSIAGVGKVERQYGLVEAIPVMTAPCKVKYLKPVCELIVVKLSVGGELGGAWELDLSPKAPSLIKKGTGTLKLQIGVGGEIEKLGGKLVATGGGTGAVKLGPWTQDPWIQKFEGSIDYSLNVVFKIFTTEYKHSLACTYEPPPAGWSCGANVQSGLTPVSQSTQMLRPVPAMSRTEPVEASDAGDPVVLRNVSPLAEPAAAARGDRALMLYLGENESLGASAQRLDLRYTNASGTPLQWRESKAVTSDGNGDFNPAVVWTSSATAVAAWERVANSALSFSDVSSVEDLPKLSRELDIAAATYDAANDRWSPVTMLTSDQLFDSSPTLAALDDGRAILVWLRQSADLTGAQQLVSRILENGVWSSERVIANDLQGVDRLALASSGSRATLVVSRDRDGNTDTAGDGDLALYEYRDNSWTVRRDVTSDAENDVLPILTSEADGAHVYWSRNGKLATRVLPDGPIELIQPEDAADPANTIVATRPDGAVALAWSTGTTLYGRLRDPRSKKWSGAITLAERLGPASSLTAFSSSEGLLHVAGAETELAYEDVTRVIDGKTVVIKDVPTPGRVDLVDYALSLHVDVAADRLQPAQSTYLVGETIVFTANVTNTGRVAVSNVPVELRSGTALAASTMVNGDWLPGESRDLSLSLPYDGSARAFTLVLDPASTLSDTQRANNSITYVFGNAAPRSCLQASAAKGATPLSVTFDSSCSADSDGAIVSRRWLFGDASSADGTRVTHQYAEAGTYTATLVITDDGGSTSTASIEINVATGENRKGPGRAHSLYVPVVGRVAGVGGSFFVTDISLRNTDAVQPLEIDAVYLPDGKEEFHRRITLQGGETLQSPDILARIFGSSDGTGALRLDLSHPHAALVARTYNQQSDGTAGFSSNAVTTDQALYDGERGTILQHWLPGYRTNIGFTEIAGVDTQVTATAYAENGTAIGTETFALGPYVHQQFNGRPIFQNRGRIEVTIRGGAVIPYVATLDGQTSDPILQSAERVSAAAAQSSLLVPIVGRLRGANNSTWRSDVRVFNPGPSALRVSVELRTGGGTHTATLDLVAGQTGSFDDVISTLFPQLNGDLGGALLISAPGPLLVTSRTFNLSSKGTYGLYIPARSRDKLLAAGATAQLLQIQENAAYRTNLGLAAFDGPAAIRVRALDGRGNVLASKAYHVGAGLNSQIGFVLADMRVADPSKATALEVTATEGTVFVYASIIDNRTGDATFVEAGQ